MLIEPSLNSAGPLIFVIFFSLNYHLEIMLLVFLYVWKDVHYCFGITDRGWSLRLSIASLTYVATWTILAYLLYKYLCGLDYIIVWWSVQISVLLFYIFYLWIRCTNHRYVFFYCFPTYPFFLLVLVCHLSPLLIHSQTLNTMWLDSNSQPNKKVN